MAADRRKREASSLASLRQVLRSPLPPPPYSSRRPLIHPASAKDSRPLCLEPRPPPEGRLSLWPHLPSPPCFLPLSRPRSLLPTDPPSPLPPSPPLPPSGAPSLDTLARSPSEQRFVKKNQLTPVTQTSLPLPAHSCNPPWHSGQRPSGTCARSTTSSTCSTARTLWASAQPACEAQTAEFMTPRSPEIRRLRWGVRGLLSQAKGPAFRRDRYDRILQKINHEHAE
jgi:hypothetical protein